MWIPFSFKTSGFFVPITLPLSILVIKKSFKIWFFKIRNQFLSTDKHFNSQLNITLSCSVRLSWSRFIRHLFASIPVNSGVLFTNSFILFTSQSSGLRVIIIPFFLARFRFCEDWLRRNLSQKCMASALSLILLILTCFSYLFAKIKPDPVELKPRERCKIRRDAVF